MGNAAVVDKRVFDVKLTHLLLLYVAVPIALLVVLIDQITLNKFILFSSPFRPEDWIIWVYVFGMPHVIGGMQMFADKEYLKVYGWKLFRIISLCLVLPPLVSVFIGEQSMFLIFMMFIVYHTVAQQFGLTLVALKKKPDFFFYVWKWSSIGVGAVLYMMLYFVPFPIVLSDNGVREPLMLFGKILLGIVVLAASIIMWRNRTNRLGMVYVASNAVLIFTECYLFYMHYFFLVVILGRIIHEFTAWPIYIAHDHNRNLVDTKNWIYRLFKNSFAPAVISVISAFVLGSVLTFTVSSIPFMASVLVSVSIYHYYTEHFLWRRGGILRNHVNFIR